MNFALTPLEVIADRRLTLIQTRVLIALLSFSDKLQKPVFPSREKVAELTGYTVQNVSAATSDLVRLGWLEKSGNRGRSRASLYTIKVPDPDTLSEKKKVSEPNTKKVSEPNTKKVSEPDTSIEQTNEQTNEQTREKSPKNGTKKKFEIPPWVNPKAWQEFEQHRREIKMPLTLLSRTKAANQLKPLTQDEQQRCVDMTIANHWRGLFPERVKNENGKRNHGQSAAQRNADIDEYLTAKICGTA